MLPSTLAVLQAFCENTRTALRGGNPYRAKAYSRAADSLAALATPLYVLGLTEIPGVGEAIADIITELHKTGTHPWRCASGQDPAEPGHREKRRRSPPPAPCERA